MSRKIEITIPEPCHENWQEMTAREKGRFCDLCQKNVIDFTKASDRQIVGAYNKNQNLCGRFLNTQLNRELVKPKEKNSVWLATTSAILSFLALGTNESYAQGEPRIVQADKKIISENIPIENDSIKEKTITGIVIDVSGAPLPGINIIVKGLRRGTSTDFDGKYSIKAKEGETLIFSFLGMEEQTMIVGKSDYYRIFMTDDEKNISTGIVVTAYRKRTFLGRTFKKIGNIFK